MCVCVFVGGVWEAQEAKIGEEMLDTNDFSGEERDDDENTAQHS